jgi:hypothetical protein
MAKKNHCWQYLLCLYDAEENRQVSDAEYRQVTDSVIDKLIDAERVTTLLLKDISTAAQAGPAPSSQAALAAAAAAAAATQEANINWSLRQQYRFLQQGGVNVCAAVRPACCHVAHCAIVVWQIVPHHAIKLC